MSLPSLLLNRANVSKLKFANHDPVHCLAPGLFRSLKRGECDVKKLRILYQFNEDTMIEFRGDEPLGVDDMRVLQGLVGMASLQIKSARQVRTPIEATEDRLLRVNLELDCVSDDCDVLTVRGSFRQLARELGYASPDCGSLHRRLRASIERLWAVSVIVDHRGRRHGFRMLSHYASDQTQNGAICVALNPRLTRAVLSQAGDQYYRIDMEEVRGLTSDPVHQVHPVTVWQALHDVTVSAVHIQRHAIGRYGFERPFI